MRALLKPDLNTFLSALLLAAAAPYWGQSWLAPVLLIPWLFALSSCRTRKRAVILGVQFGFFFTVLGFHWVADVLGRFGHLPTPVAWALFLLYAIGAQSVYAFCAPVIHDLLLRRRMPPVMFVALTASAYTALDWALPKLFKDTLGHIFHDSQILIQAADIGGAHLLTWVIVASNAALFLAIRAVRDRSEPSIWPSLAWARGGLVLAAAGFLAVMAYGVLRSAQLTRHMAGPHPRVPIAMIQGNIGDFEKIMAESGIRGGARRVLSTMFELSEEALRLTPRPKVLIWPETAYPSTFRTPDNPDEQQRDQMIEEFAKKSGVSLLFGGYDRAFNRDFNAFFFLNPKGGLQIYQKSILLLFGEYIPGFDEIDWLRDNFPQVGNFGRGVGPSLLTVDSGDPKTGSFKVGPIICYEALFPNYILDAARKGGQAIFNITNDSWFGTTGEPELHLALTRFRSVEARLPQVRTTNTGISALILPDGSMPVSSAKGQAQIIPIELPLIPPLPTLMRAWGDWIGYLAWALFIGLGLVARSRYARS